MSVRLRHCLILTSAVCLFGGGRAKAQEDDSLYSLILYAGGGYSLNLSPFDILPPGLQRNGFGGSVRLMWKPEHLLRVGLETGIIQVYSIRNSDVQSPFGTTDFSSSLHAIPLALMFSMPIVQRLDGYIGSTSYLLFSDTKSFGNSTRGLMLSIGFSAALTYMWMIDDEWAVGAELKWYHVEKSRDDNVMLYVVFSYPLLEW